MKQSGLTVIVSIPYSASNAPKASVSVDPTSSKAPDFSREPPCEAFNVAWPYMLRAAEIYSWG